MEREWLGERRLRQRLHGALMKESHCGVAGGRRQRGEVVKSARPDPAQSCQLWLGLEDFILGVLSKGVTSSFGSQRSSDSWDEPGL